MPTMKIGSLTLTLPSPYASGHTCTAAEAQVLNHELQRRLRKNISDRFFERIDRALGTVPEARSAVNQEIQMEIAKYIRSFSLNGTDPITTTAYEIALSIVREKIKASGKRLGDYKPAALREEAEKLLRGSQGHVILAKAKAEVEWTTDRAAELGPLWSPLNDR